jgi:hypothetical protein
MDAFGLIAEAQVRLAWAFQLRTTFSSSSLPSRSTTIFVFSGLVELSIENASTA